LDNILPADVKPTVVVMNPPASQTAGRMGDKRDIMVGANHSEQALKRLEPGGRLVAMVGRGMTMGAPKFRRWWEKIESFHARHAAVPISRRGAARTPAASVQVSRRKKQRHTARGLPAAAGTYVHVTPRPVALDLD
jgi:hypothetical protein